MPDRRQGDRRESSKFEKKISISLGNFIFILIIFILVIASIFICSYVSSISFNKGYAEGSKDNYNDYWDIVYEEDFLDDPEEDFLDDSDEDF